MKIAIDIPDDLKNQMNDDNYENIIRWYSATLYCAIKNGTPLDDLRSELGRCKTFHEMQLSERDTKGKLMISDIFCHIIAIIDGYTTDKEESENKE